MDSIGIRDLRADLAAAVRRAGSGHSMVITIDGRGMATLGPIDADPGTGGMAALIARGLVSPPRRADAPRLSEPVPVPVWSAARLDRLAAELRGR